MTSFFIPCLCVVMAKDVEVASLFQPYRCRVAHLLGSHLDQVAGAVIEARKRFCKKQQMQWSKSGAHLLLQTRVKTLDGELGAIFKRWYPDMDIEVQEMPVAA